MVFAGGVTPGSSPYHHVSLLRHDGLAESSVTLNLAWISLWVGSRSDPANAFASAMLYDVLLRGALVKFAAVASGPADPSVADVAVQVSGTIDPSTMIVTLELRSAAH